MFIAPNSLIMANNFFSDRPAMAHFRFVGRLVEMHSAQSFPVYPVAPSTTISYILGRRSDIVESKWYDKMLDGGIEQRYLSIGSSFEATEKISGQQ